MVSVISAALASSAGSALVWAMSTDSWDGLRMRVARLLARGNPTNTTATLKQLEKSRATLTGLSGADLERTRAEQEVIWRTRLRDLLEQYPESEDELRGLVAEIQALVIGSSGTARVEQHVAGFDQAQQAVQGHGVQNVMFGIQNTK